MTCTPSTAACGKSPHMTGLKYAWPQHQMVVCSENGWTVGTHGRLVDRAKSNYMGHCWVSFNKAPFCLYDVHAWPSIGPGFCFSSLTSDIRTVRPSTSSSLCCHKHNGSAYRQTVSKQAMCKWLNLFLNPGNCGAYLCFRGPSCTALCSGVTSSPGKE